jgi:nicotinate-nucleotide pyrophosphorylase (carboxylating)
MDLNKLISDALTEDRADNDVTTRCFVFRKKSASAKIISKQTGVICGLDIAAMVFSRVNKSCGLKKVVEDGAKVKKGQVLAVVKGPAAAILSGERTALNFLGHLSGISTLTNEYVLKVKGTCAKIYDTRKTTPGLRVLEKYAVLCGGGYNHRMDLAEMALIKDNHIGLSSSVKAGILKIRRNHPGLKIEMECENFSQLREALEYRVEIIMLDNMNAAKIRQAVRLINNYVKRNNVPEPDVEVSGGVNLGNVRGFALAGVGRISIGALTHSAKALDVSLEIYSKVSKSRVAVK